MLLSSIDLHLERIQINDKQVDFLDAVILARLLVVIISADCQETTMNLREELLPDGGQCKHEHEPRQNLRMERLDTAIHHLWKASEVRDVDDRQAGILESFRSSASGQDLKVT